MSCPTPPSLGPTPGRSINMWALKSRSHTYHQAKSARPTAEPMETPTFPPVVRPGKGEKVNTTLTPFIQILTCRNLRSRSRDIRWCRRRRRRCSLRDWNVCICSLRGRKDSIHGRRYRSLREYWHEDCGKCCVCHPAALCGALSDYTRVEATDLSNSISNLDSILKTVLRTKMIHALTKISMMQVSLFAR